MKIERERAFFLAIVLSLSLYFYCVGNRLTGI